MINDDVIDVHDVLIWLLKLVSSIDGTYKKCKNDDFNNKNTEMWYNGDTMGRYDDKLNIFRLFTYEKWLVNAVVDLTIK